MAWDYLDFLHVFASLLKNSEASVECQFLAQTGISGKALIRVSFKRSQCSDKSQTS